MPAGLRMPREEATMGMPKDEIDARLMAFIRAQHIFFVATAPRSSEGHINVSPKGLDTLRILGPRTVGYLDLAGSGIETVAHLRENARLTLLFCAFEGKSMILRLYGRGRVIEPIDPEWNTLAAEFPRYPGARTIVVMDVERVADSCGFGVPLFAYQGERSELSDWAEQKGEDGLQRYKTKHNARSIDGLSGLRSCEPTGATDQSPGGSLR
jgi:hypothetical protein